MELERLMVDYFRANEQQPEIDHNFKGENVNKGTGISGGKWCSSKGGYFSFEMTVDPDIPSICRLCIGEMMAVKPINLTF